MCEHSAMGLQKFLRDQKRKPSHFARELGISKSYFSEILSGKKGVSLDLAFKIEHATNGAVTARDMAGDHRKESAA